MKKYTVIYMDCFWIGCHKECVPRLLKIETDDLSQHLKNRNIEPYFVLEGWPKEL